MNFSIHCREKAPALGVSRAHPRSVTDLLPVLFSVLLVLCSCSRPSTVTETKIALGTYVRISLVTEKGKVDAARQAVEEGYRLIQRYESTFNYRTVEGDLARFNRTSVLFRRKNPQLFSLVNLSLELARLTEGYFDPTILPVIKVWGFDTEDPSLPGTGALAAALQRVGYRQVEVAEDRIKKPKHVQLDLSGIAKGKAVDLLRDHLWGRGYHDFLIDAGGDISVSGTRERGQPWRVAVQDPKRQNRYRGILTIGDAAVVTSGDYERFFTQDGVRYTHLFNPRTGYPESDCRSVTVVSEDAAFGDAVATAVFVMGREQGFRFLQEHGIRGLILFEGEEGKLQSISTPGFWE